MRVAIDIDRTTVALADSVRVTLTVSNVSSRTAQVLMVSAFHGCGQSSVEVHDAQTRLVVGSEPGFCARANWPEPLPIELAPGEEVKRTSWLTPAKSWSLPTGNGSSDYRPMSPGQYNIRGRVNVGERGVFSATRQFTVE